MGKIIFNIFLTFLGIAEVYWGSKLVLSDVEAMVIWIAVVGFALVFSGLYVFVFLLSRQSNQKWSMSKKSRCILMISQIIVFTCLAFQYYQIKLLTEAVKSMQGQGL